MRTPALHVVMYHYVRDLPRTRYPRLHAILVDDFRGQIAWLREHFEMATLESSLEFLSGRYTPRRDLCLCTFDDGLKEHWTEVMPVLAGDGIQGLFGVITSCVHEHRVAPVHMNHFLMAALGFDEYRTAFLRELEGISEELVEQFTRDAGTAERSYPLDTREVAMFKWMVNFTLPVEIREAVMQTLFQRHFGDERAFARDLYMSWDEVRQLQNAGMLVAGHTHYHRPLATLSSGEMECDLQTSSDLLRQHTGLQELWPFSYPYGKRDSYSKPVIEVLRTLGFHCAFGTEPGDNRPGQSEFELLRVDSNGGIELLRQNLANA